MADDRNTLWLTGQDESVEVNQRALIDKVLARYSGEFTVFRELLQNSDDARSSAAEIRFETAAYLRRKNEQGGADVPPLPSLKSVHVAQWTFRNNGITFRDEDWTRLRKIAEGNPDEEKIGAFGVGFYSLFSVTENPFVSSGGHGMQFYWKDNKDQLNVRRGDLPSKSTADPWTTFEMTLREAGPIPPVFDLMRFLASSVTFMVHLSDVSVYFDEHRIGHIGKSPGVAKVVDLPRGLKRSSQSNIMQVKGVQSHTTRIKAQVMHAVYAVGTEKRSLLDIIEPRKLKGGFFSSLVSAFTSQSTSQLETPALPSQPPKDPMELHEMNVTLTVFTAQVDIRIDKRLSAELLRSTKKNPPVRLKYDLIYTGKDEYDLSLADDKGQPVACGGIFEGLRADLNGVGHTRVFIGHATSQTTGIGGHMASRFIPTVERESIDLVDRNVAVWNKELLYVGGFLARAAYELELSNIQSLWEGAAKASGTPDLSPPQELKDWLLRRFIHVLKFFTFHHSTPSSEVSKLLEASFYACSTLPLRLLSSAGVRGASDIKEFDPVFSTFLKYLPVLSQFVIQEGTRTIRSLQAQGMLSPITFIDVLGELRQHPLGEEELIGCLKWWTSLKQDDSDVNMAQNRAQLLNAAVLSSADGRVLPLSSVQHFINTRTLGTHIPSDGPLPITLMPLSVTKHFTSSELTSFSWCEFTIIDWLQHVSQPDVASANPDHDFTKSTVWAERVLIILSRVWSSLSNEMHTSARKVFAGKKCIPTSCGLTPPELSYFPNTNMTLFSDLPLVQFQSGLIIRGQMEKLLSFIGVRKHVDLQLVFDRMVKTGGWSISDLVGYLVQVRDTLTAEELARLASTAAFTEEGTPAAGKKPRYCARDLYEPTEIFRELQLPVLDWGEGSKWRSNSEEAKLLYRLGLRRFPPLATTVTLCSSLDATVRAIAFKYLCDNIPSKYPDYSLGDFGHVAFIPSDSEDGAHLAKIGEVFSEARWRVFGFSVVQDSCREAAVSKLGIQPHPPTSMLLSLLEKTPPPNESIAQQWFEILASRISSFTQPQLTIISKLPIVPIKGSGAQPLRWLAPTQCYLGDGTKGEFHSKLFVFVDFGPVANRFLSACGSKSEPSIDEVAKILISDPKKFYTLSGGYENFLAELRNLAVNSHTIAVGTMNKMKISPILLGMRRQKALKMFSDKTPLTEWDEEGWEDLHDLRRPNEIVIADDTNAYHLFSDSIFAAPQEDLLESFYTSLGSRHLSTVVREDYRVSNEIADTKTAFDVRTLVLERLPLFLHEHTHARTKVSLSWLSSAHNFKVKVFSKLVVSKTLDISNSKTTRTLDASAAAKRVGAGPIELWLSYSAQVDMYEVATSLCRLLFEKAKVNDALLFMTILSTDLKALKRRGYNVDKILKQQQQNRKMAEEARRSRYIGPEATDSTTTLVPQPVAPQPVKTNHPSSIETRSKPHFPSPGLPGAWESASGSPLPPRVPPPAVTPSVSERPPNEIVTTRPPIPPSTPEPTNNALLTSNTLEHLRRLVSRMPSSSELVRSSPSPQAPQNTRHVTPQSNIRANVDLAIKACKPEEGTLLHNRKKMEIVKESLNEGYCDTTGQIGNLEFLGKMGDMRVFITKDVPDPDTFMMRVHDSLARFIHVVTPLAQIYNLPTTSLHIFYDMAGGLIAFNRNGSIFLNLRYFEAWHDQDVKNGHQQQAHISWFFTLAHEIAHNLIEPHNSEHEFYFSAICEAHMVALSQLMGASEV